MQVAPRRERWEREEAASEGGAGELLPTGAPTQLAWERVTDPAEECPRHQEALPQGSSARSLFPVLFPRKED